MIDQKTIRELLDYDPQTGVFTWLKGRGPRAPMGSMAGSVHYSGYRNISIKGSSYRAHRLAWFLENGEWPSDQVDHVNGIRDDNRIENLRVVSNQENSRNQAMPVTNTSGVVGVCWHRTKNKWQAEIRVDGKKITIGRYFDFFEAISARKSAEERYGFHKNHGRKPIATCPG